MLEYGALLDLAEKLSCKVLIDEPMRFHTTFKVGGNADVFLTVPDIKALSSVLKLCGKNNRPVLKPLSEQIFERNFLQDKEDDRGNALCLTIHPTKQVLRGPRKTDDKVMRKIAKKVPRTGFQDRSDIRVYIVGNGSNLLVSDEGFRGVFLKLGSGFSNIEAKDDTIVCGAGVSLAKLCKFAQENSLSGLEFAWGIPGSVGGAAFMNAGAYNSQIEDVIVESSYMTKAGQEGKLLKDEMNMSYRHSAYMENGHIITSLVLKLKEDNPLVIKQRMDDFMECRRLKQPLEFPSAGSIFKRPEGFFAGQLIEACGLKGICIGDACVSDKHSGFIINRGNATCKDIKALISLIKKTVLEKQGVALECEVKII